MSLEQTTEIDGGVRARFRWSKGGAGTMSLTFRSDDLVSELVIEFDDTTPA
jgi:hypothetical protein